MEDENVPFIDSVKRQNKARELVKRKYKSKEDGSFGLLKDYDNDPSLAEEVEVKKPWKIYVVCLAGENRSRLIAGVLEDEDVGEKKKLNYLAGYGGTNFSFPVMEKEIDEFGPDAIIFATRTTRKTFEEKFPRIAEKMKEKKILGRSIGLSDSRVSLTLDKGDEKIGKLKDKIRGRLLEMGFQGLTTEDLEKKWADVIKKGK